MRAGLHSSPGLGGRFLSAHCLGEQPYSLATPERLTLNVGRQTSEGAGLSNRRRPLGLTLWQGPHCGCSGFQVSDGGHNMDERTPPAGGPSSQQQGPAPSHHTGQQSSPAGARPAHLRRLPFELGGRDPLGSARRPSVTPPPSSQVASLPVQQSSEADLRTCGKCGTANPAVAPMCLLCGASLNSATAHHGPDVSPAGSAPAPVSDGSGCDAVLSLAPAESPPLARQQATVPAPSSPQALAE